MASRLALVELISSDVQLRYSEAASIVAELCRHHAQGRLRAIPSPHVIRLTADGDILVEGPVDTEDSPVRRAAELLDTLLPSFGAAPACHVPGGLRIAVARALGTLDLPPYRSLEEFRGAIERFVERDARQAVRDLYERWRQAAAMTISDIRRARRATRMPLERVARRTGIPVVRLRELEWGYLRNWSADDRSRDWLARYARVAGLDEQVLIEAVWPLIEAAAPATATELVPSPPRALVPTHMPAPQRPWRSFDRWLAVAAAAAVTIAVVPALWLHGHSSSAHRDPAASQIVAMVSRPETVATGTTGVAPVARPAIVPAAYVPSTASLGTAVFVRENGSDAVLRITKVNDEGARDFHARPSPDGTRVAFDSDRDGTRAVFVADADGTHVRRISGDGFAAIPSWSPDGRQLAYVKAEPNAPDVWNLWIADVSSERERRLTDYANGESWGASWFPDGQHVVFGRGNRIMMLDVGKGTGRALSVLPQDRSVRSVAVSPGGRRVIFSVERDGAWLLDVAAGVAHRVLDDPTAENFAWGPDGRRVAFHSERAGGWSVCILEQ